MSRLAKMRAAVLCGALLLPLTAIAAELRNEGDINPEDRTYVSCEWRVAAIFPSAPAVKDITYTSNGMSVPARQFSVQQGADVFSVTIANFSNGPAVDERIVESAAVPLRQRGMIQFQFEEVYDPGIPGRQINLLQPDGRQLRASVYMADHHLYVTEATAPEGDFAALQFEQSVSIIDAKGTDLDKNGDNPSRQYACK